jgi:hypothetical protein
MLIYEASILQGNREQIKASLSPQVMVLRVGSREVKPWYTYILPLNTRGKAS